MTATFGEIKSPAGVVEAVKLVEVLVSDPTVALAVGDGKACVAIPAALDGMKITDVAAFLTAPSAAAVTTVQINNLRANKDLLTTRLTIDTNETSSYDALVPPVIDPTLTVVRKSDVLRIDVDTTGTGARGLLVAITLTGDQLLRGETGATGATGPSGGPPGPPGPGVPNGGLQGQVLTKATNADQDTQWTAGMGSPDSGWSIVGGYTPDKSFNPELTSVTELARTLGTLIDTLKAKGLLGG